jgi:serine protease Do
MPLPAMKGLGMKTLLALGGTVAVLVAGLALPPHAGAQYRTGSPLLLYGPGSSIGLTVRDTDTGVRVESVRPEGPAARAGVQPGDMVAEFDGERARSATQFSRLVRDTAPGRSVSMTIVRGGSRQALDVTPEDRPAADLRLPDVTLDVRPFRQPLPTLPRDFQYNFNWSFSGQGRLGVNVSQLSSQLATYFGVKQGALVNEVETGSPAEAAGLRAGDVITSINGRAVSTPGDVVDIVRDASAGSSLEIRVMRDRREQTLTAKLPERARPAAGGRPV